MLTRVIEFILIIAIFSFAACSGNKGETQCSKFHNGRFTLRSVADHSIDTIIRNDSTQIEKNEKSEIVSVSKIKWLTPSKYELTGLLLDSNHVSPAILVEVEIIKSNKEYCIFKATTPGFDIVYIDTLKIAD
jgi:hypothetical protein